MKKHVAAAIVIMIMAYALTACANDLALTVTFPTIEGLKDGDRVLWENNSIGEVKKVVYTSEGDFKVSLVISQNFRNAATDKTRFVIIQDPGNESAKAVELVQMGKGELLKEDAQVRGSTRYDVWSESLQEKWSSFLDSMKQVPEEQWAKDLQKQMEEIAETLKQAGQETKKKLKEEIIPQLEKNLEELKKKLKGQGKEKEAEPLDKQMEKIKSI